MLLSTQDNPWSCHMGSEFTGTHHFHGVSHRERHQKHLQWHNKLHCHSHRMAQVGLSCFGFWPLRTRMTAEACHTGMDGTFSSEVTEESCSGSCESLPAYKDHQLHGAADLFRTVLWATFLQSKPDFFILSPALMWKKYTIYTNIQYICLCLGLQQWHWEEKVSEIKGESMSRWQLWKSLFCWTAFSIN